MLRRTLLTTAVTDPTTQLLIVSVPVHNLRYLIIVQNGILNIFNLFVAIIAGMLCNKVGRRRLFMISTVGARPSDAVLRAGCALMRRADRHGAVLDTADDLLRAVRGAPLGRRGARGHRHDLCVAAPVSRLR